MEHMIRCSLCSESAKFQRWRAAFWLISSADVATPPALAALPGANRTPTSRIASGVGKSTFLQILGTLDLPSSGSIKFDGEELTHMTPGRLAEFRNRRIGFVFQFHHLLPEFTALENVMMPCLVQRMPKAVARKQAAEILGQVGLTKRMTHRPSELSGGEQQRVALARAMVLNPALLLADEPTGNLDRSTGAAIHQLFLELNRERGSTLLVVTHNPELADLMPRRLRMVDGGLTILVRRCFSTPRGRTVCSTVASGVA